MAARLVADERAFFLADAGVRFVAARAFGSAAARLRTACPNQPVPWSKPAPRRWFQPLSPAPLRKRAQRLFGALQCVETPGNRKGTWINERIAVVAASQSTWARRRKLTLAALIEEPRILSQVEIREGTPVQRALAASGLQAREVAAMLG